MKIRLSPIRYPGGKTRAVKHILPLIPDNVREVVSPFMGGGSVEVNLEARGVRVHAYDAYMPLVNFWRYALQHPHELAEAAEKYRPLPKDLFYQLQKGFGEIDNSFERAVVFFVLNRTSYCGTTLSGGMAQACDRFQVSSISRLHNFKASMLSVDFMDYRDSLHKHRDAFAYLDPPYVDKSNLYGTRGDMHGFDHEELASILRDRTSDWVLSYNDHPLVRNLYPFCHIRTPEWAYGNGLSKSTKSNEVLITPR